MTTSPNHRPGAPCWVDTLQPDPSTAMGFYGSLFGWTFTPAPGSVDGDHVIARCGGLPVAGIGRAPLSSTGRWRTHVCVDDLEGALTRVERCGGARGPEESGPGGRVVTIADSTGTPLCLWQPAPGTDHGGTGSGEPSTWAMSSLHTGDLTRAADFYGTVLGWQFEDVPDAPVSRCLQAGRVVALATETPSSGAVPQHWSVALAVDDADAVARRATAWAGTS